MAIRIYKNNAWQDIAGLKAQKNGVFADVPSANIDVGGVSKEVYPSTLWIIKNGIPRFEIVRYLSTPEHLSNGGYRQESDRIVVYENNSNVYRGIETARVDINMIPYKKLYVDADIVDFISNIYHQFLFFAADKIDGTDYGVAQKGRKVYEMFLPENRTKSKVSIIGYYIRTIYVYNIWLE